MNIIGRRRYTTLLCPQLTSVSRLTRVYPLTKGEIQQGGRCADWNQPPMGVSSDIYRGFKIRGRVLANAFGEDIGLLTSFYPVKFTYITVNTPNTIASKGSQC